MNRAQRKKPTPKPSARRGGKKSNACYDCGLPYDSPKWADIVIPDELWRKISPTHDEGGLLCFNCMNGRLAALKLRNVPYEIASGPLSFWVRDVTGETHEAGRGGA